MTREEAVRWVLAAAREYQYVVYYNKNARSKLCEAISIVTKALNPQPDAETGLMPCGCGGKAECCGNSGDYDSYSFECIKCETGTLSFNTKEDAKNAWNRAMGWFPPLLEANE